MAKPKAPAPSALVPRVKVWFEAEGGYGFGSGLIAILQAVERTGSIKAAADDLGRSYRHVWDRVKEAERAAGLSLVVTQVGGQGVHRSDLTDDARRLVADFLALRDRMIAVMEEEFARQGHGGGSNRQGTE